MEMTSLKNELREACYEVARTTMYQKGPIDAESIATLAEQHFQNIEHHLEYLEKDTHQGHFLVDAVRFLIHAVAIPPMRDDQLWFENMIEVLVVLAKPNAVLGNDHAEFYRQLASSSLNKLAQLASSKSDADA